MASPDTAGILAALLAEFGKPRAKAKAGKGKKRAAPGSNILNSDGTLKRDNTWTEGKPTREQTVVFEEPLPAAIWQLYGQIILIQHQHCECCGNSVSAMLGVLRQEINRFTGSSRTVRAPCPPDTLRIVEEGHITTPFCAKCLTIEALTEDLVVAIDDHRQAALFR